MVMCRIVNPSVAGSSPAPGAERKASSTLLGTANQNFKLPTNKTRIGTFADQVTRYVRERYHGHASYVYAAAWIDRRTWSAIVTNPLRPVAKRTVLQFAVALQLTRTEADTLLAAAGYALSPVIAEDVVSAFAIEERLGDLFKVNQILYDNGLKIIPVK